MTAQDVQDPPVWHGPRSSGRCPICGGLLVNYKCAHTAVPPARPAEVK